MFFLGVRDLDRLIPVCSGWFRLVQVEAHLDLGSGRGVVTCCDVNTSQHKLAGGGLGQFVL